MKRKIKFLVYPLAVILVSLFVIVGCSDDKDEVLPDDDKPGKVYDIDGNEYKTVKIGDQIWMAENLRVSKYNNGDTIPTGLNEEEWKNTTNGAYAIYNNNDNMLEVYGKLYNWYAVDDERSICPEGWSVPSDDDWTQLVDYIMDEYDYHNDRGSEDINGVGNALKSCRQVDHPDSGDCDTSEHPRWDSDGTHQGFDQFGFSALPGGLRYTSGSYGDIGYDGYWWSSNEYSSTNAWYRYIGGDYGYVGRYYVYKHKGFGIRCFRHIEN